MLFINTEDKSYVPLGMEGDDGDVTIPVVCIQHSFGAEIKSLLRYENVLATIDYGDAPPPPPSMAVDLLRVSPAVPHSSSSSRSIKLLLMGGTGVGIHFHSNR